METVDQVVKGGIVWFELALTRRRAGLEVHVKTSPEVEQFMKGLGDGVRDGAEIYARKWQSVDVPLEVYRLEESFPKNPNYFIDKPCELFSVFVREGRERDERINLSFFRLVGIGETAGVRFVVPGAYSAQYVDELSKKIITESRNLIRDFIVPVNINLRISSLEA